MMNILTPNLTSHWTKPVVVGYSFTSIFRKIKGEGREVLQCVQRSIQPALVGYFQVFHILHISPDPFSSNFSVNQLVPQG